MEKPKPKSKILKPGDDAGEVVNDLMKKLITEQRLHEKDETLHLARTGKRDVAVHISVTVLGRQDGHPIFGEQDKEYNQWCFVLPAKALPVPNHTAIKALSELAHIAKSALMKLGMVRER